MLFFVNLLLSFGFSQVDMTHHIDLNGKRMLELSCIAGDPFCVSTCKADTCIIELPSCRDCMSTGNNSLQVFLVSIGSHFVPNLESPLNPTQVREYLTTGALIAWDAKSIYNTSEYNGPFIRQRFMALCPADSFTKDPMVLDQLDAQAKFSFGSSKVVACFYEHLGLQINPLQYK